MALRLREQLARAVSALIASPGRAAPAVAFVVCIGCGTTNAADPPSCAKRAALRSGALASGDATSFTLRIFDSATSCTAVALAPTRLVTAAHCLPKLATTAALSVRRGPTAAECLSSSADPCAPAVFAVALDTEHDVALLTSSAPLSNLAAEALPVVRMDDPPAEFDAYGFGIGSFVVDGGVEVPSAEGAHLIQARFSTSAVTPSDFDASAVGSAVCDGDSGGPAVSEVGGTPALLGILHDSDSAPGSHCTPPNGTQTWARLSAALPFIEAVAGACPRRNVGDGAVADCRSSGGETPNGCD